jgi:glucokinase-like ROK family protein
MNIGTHTAKTRYNSPYSVNRSTNQVIQLLREHESLSRNEIATLLGFSRTKVTSIVAELISFGLIEEGGSADSNGGRRPRTLAFTVDFGYIIGIDMRVTSLNIAVANFRGELIGSMITPISIQDSPDQIIKIIGEQVLLLLDEHQLHIDKVIGIGFGIPSPVDFESGLIISKSIMIGWENYPIREALHKIFPRAAILIDNEVNLMALGELRAGMGREYKNLIFVKVGTGIGAGIISNGHIHRGSTGCEGQIGHISVDPQGPVCHCGNVGCLELIAGASAIAQRAKKHAVDNPESILAKQMEENHGILSAEDVGIAAMRGDRFANEIIQDSGRQLGKVLATLVTLLNPDAVLIGGGVSNIGSQFLVAIRREVLQLSIPLSTRHLVIDLSSIQSEAGVTGAITLALDHIFAVEQ